MTDTTTGFEQQFAGDNSTTAFAVTNFLIADDDDIQVYLLNETTKAATLQTKTTHYTVAVADAGTFTVNFLTAPTTDEQVFITINKSRIQSTDFIINGKLSEQALEEQLDEFPRQAKSLESDIKRSIKGPVGFGDGELSVYPALGLVRINENQNGFEAVTVTGLNLTDLTFDWDDLADLGGSLDNSADKILVYDASATENKFVNPEDLLGTVTASNEGTAGVGVFYQKDGDNLEFKNISVGSAKVTVTDDTGNNEIDIDVDAGKILDDEFTTNGLCTRTAADTYTNRTITATAGETSVADGDGVSGNPTIGLADNAQMPGTEGIRLPNGTTGQRPASPAVGDLRYNTTTGKAEVYQGSSWLDVDAVDINGLTQESTVDSANDVLVMYDNSAAANRKVDINDLTAGMDVDQLDLTTATTNNSVDHENDIIIYADASNSNVTRRTTMDNIGLIQRVSSTAVSTASSVDFNNLALDDYDYQIILDLTQDTAGDSHYFELDTDDSGTADWDYNIGAFAAVYAGTSAGSQATALLMPSGGKNPPEDDFYIEIHLYRNNAGNIQYRSDVASQVTRYFGTGQRTNTSSDNDLTLTVTFSNASGSAGLSGTATLNRIPK